MKNFIGSLTKGVVCTGIFLGAAVLIAAYPNIAMSFVLLFLCGTFTYIFYTKGRR